MDELFVAVCDWFAAHDPPGPDLAGHLPRLAAAVWGAVEARSPGALAAAVRDLLAAPAAALDPRIHRAVGERLGGMPPAARDRVAGYLARLPARTWEVTRGPGGEDFSGRVEFPSPAHLVPFLPTRIDPVAMAGPAAPPAPTGPMPGQGTAIRTGVARPVMPPGRPVVARPVPAAPPGPAGRERRPGPTSRGSTDQGYRRPSHSPPAWAWWAAGAAAAVVVCVGLMAVLAVLLLAPAGNPAAAGPDRTYRYWVEVKGVMDLTAAPWRSGLIPPAETARRSREMARAVEAVPSAGADVLAVNHVRELAGLLRNIAETYELMARQGEAERREEARSLWDVILAFQQMEVALRVTLAGQYGREFPPLVDDAQ